MKSQHQHKVVTSFMLWFDHYLLNKGEAYHNETGQYFNYSDTRIPSSYEVFGSPYKQFVYNSSITGANIPSGVYVNGVWKDRDDGIIFDFDNGRIMSTGLLSSDIITGSFGVKDVNVYSVNANEEDLIVEKKYSSTAEFPQNNTWIPPYDFTVPAVFINAETFQNKPFAFGGEDTTSSFIKGVVIADNPYILDGVLSIFSDSFNEAFKLLPFEAYPVNEYGDLKSTPSFNYTGFAAASGEGLLFINNVVTSKLTDRAKASLETNLFIGFLDFEVATQRFPRL